MRKLIAITQVTLDGVMQSPGGPEEDPRNGFTHGGWVMPFWDDALNQAIGETIAGEFNMLLGRRTYEIFAAYWPNQGDNPIAKAFNKATKYVVTRSLDQLDWENSLHIGGDVVDEVRRLKASDGPALHIWGSSELLQTLIAAELVDEYRIWVFPLVLGEGKRLFENGVPPGGLALVETRSTPRGVLINTYRFRWSGQNRVVLIGNAVRSGTGSAEETGSRRLRNLTNKNIRRRSRCASSSFRFTAHSTVSSPAQRTTKPIFCQTILNGSLKTLPPITTRGDTKKA